MTSKSGRSSRQSGMPYSFAAGAGALPTNLSLEARLLPLVEVLFDLDLMAIKEGTVYTLRPAGLKVWLRQIEIFFASQPANSLGRASRGVLRLRVRRIREKRVQRFQPQRLGFKHAAKVAGGKFGHLFQLRNISGTAHEAVRHLLLQ